MTIDRLTNLVLIVGIANVICLGLLVVTAFFVVQNYLMLRRIQESLEPFDRESPIDRPASNQPQRRAALEKRTMRYDSLDEPDRGQPEWTGPVTPYIPADRLKNASDAYDERV